MSTAAQLIHAASASPNAVTSQALTLASSLQQRHNEFRSNVLSLIITTPLKYTSQRLRLSGSNYTPWRQPACRASRPTSSTS